MLEFIILGMVLDEPLTGYDLKKEIELGVGNFYNVSYGALYPMLKKLHGKGLVTMEECPQGGRQKKYYQATQAGRSAFWEWLSVPFDPADNSNALVKIFFFGALEPDVRRKRLEEIENYNTRMIHQLEQMQKKFADQELDDLDYFALSTLYFGIVNGYTTHRWLEHLKERRPHAEFLQQKEQDQ